MRRAFYALALAALAAAPPPSMGGDRTQAARVVAGSRSPSATATVVSTRVAVSPDGRPAITAASGVVLLAGRAYVAQDDSTMLAVANADGTYEAVRLFPPAGGADRFLDSLGNKANKPDVEVLFPLPAGSGSRIGLDLLRAHTGTLLVAMGSGAVPRVRDRIALVVPNEPPRPRPVVEARALGLYARLRADARLVGPGGQLNLEGAAVVNGGRTLRLFHRGTAKEAPVTSVDMPLEAFLLYLSAASKNPDAPFRARLSNVRRYDLGRSASGSPVAVTDAAVAVDPRGRELVLLSAVAEETSDVTRDGAVSATTIAVELPGGALLVAPLSSGGRPSALKVEGLAVRSVTARDGAVRLEVLGVVDPDATDPMVPSTIVEIEVVLRD